MTYEILINELVLEDDFKRIEIHHQKRILRAIREPLSQNPEKHGQLFRGDLMNLFCGHVVWHRAGLSSPEMIRAMCIF